VRNHFLRAAVANAPAYVTDNLVFHIDAGDIYSYDPDDSATTVNSLVGSITNSSYNSNISHSTSDGGYWSFEKSNPDTGDGIEFDSVTSFMPLGSSDMTYEVWAKYEYYFSVPFSLVRVLADGSESFNLFLWTTYTQFYLYKDLDFTNNIITSSNSLSSGWQHFIITHDTSTGTVKVYINGSLDTTNTDTTNWGAYSNNSNDQYLVRIGAGQAPNSGFTRMEGDISIVRFYKGKVLTATEVTQNYNAEKERYGY